MNILLLGSGGREHALAWKMAQSPQVERVFAAPGNPGIDSLAKGTSVSLGVKDFAAIDAFIEAENIGLTVVGPEDPLVSGIVDFLTARGRRVFGPCAAAAQLEGSKSFAKAFMARHDIPTAAYAEFTDAGSALAYVREKGAPIVVKADGLAAGKGVTVCRSVADAEKAIHDAMIAQVFGQAGGKVVIEECLVGEEASILAFCDGTRALAMPSSQDHKAVYDGDQGPNTGGMGAYSPAPLVTPEMEQEIMAQVLTPCVTGMALEGTPYRGVLYAGLMITATGPKVIEFNVRFGDPETQVVLPRLSNDIVPILLACCDGSLEGVELTCGSGACVSVVMASGGYPGAYEKEKVIAGIANAEREEGVTVFHAGTRRDGDVLLTNGGRVLNVTASGSDIPEAIARAYHAVGAISFDKMHFRRDIGEKALWHL